MTDITPLIARIDELEKKATPGDWVSDGRYFVGQVPEGRPGGEVIGTCWPTVDRLRTVIPNGANTALIVALRNAWPQLKATLQGLERERQNYARDLIACNDKRIAAESRAARAEAALSRIMMHIDPWSCSGAMLAAYHNARSSLGLTPDSSMPHPTQETPR